MGNERGGSGLVWSGAQGLMASPVGGSASAS
jgi:hypothetical protein